MPSLITSLFIFQKPAKISAWQLALFSQYYLILIKSSGQYTAKTIKYNCLQKILLCAQFSTPNASRHPPSCQFILQVWHIARMNKG